MLDNFDINYPGRVPSDIGKTWVGPFYLSILHGKYASKNADKAFVSSVRQALRAISPEVIDALFADMNWRCQITAAWFCGLKKWYRYEDLIGESLLKSRVCFAGQAYCFAFAHFADEKSSDYLARYLDLYLPQLDKNYDQDWAIASLMWIDEKRKTNGASRFLTEGGLWDEYIKGKTEVSGTRALARRKQSFDRVMNVSVEICG